MMDLVPCKSEYWEFVRILRNDERVSNGFISQIFITPEMQIEYMAKHSDNYRIALYNGSPAGYIGVINDDIRICTHPDFQRKGVAKFMLDAIQDIWPNSTARIKVDNLASLNLFKSCGYEIEYYHLAKKTAEKA